VTRRDGFLDRAQEVRKKAILDGTPKEKVENTPMAHTLEELAKHEGRDPEFAEFAKALNNEKWKRENTTDEWYQFILDNEDALREERPDMFSQWLEEFLRLNRAETSNSR